MTFKDLGLNDEILEALDHMNFSEPTPIQAQAIPIVLGKNDLIACAQTGTGKTAAFLLPTLNLISESNNTKGVKALIVCPTRELAIQIDRQIQGLAYFLGIYSIPIYGGGDGSDWEQQKKALKEGADIVVATPGKLISHLNMGYVNFDNLTHFILDEADRMMDMGFRDDIVKIANFLPKVRQNLMFSATMPDKIRKLIKTIMNEPKQINLAISKPAAGVLQAAYLVNDEHKARLITKLIADKPNISKIIIFTSTKSKVREVYSTLTKAGHKVGAISSDYEQDQREEVLRSFKAKRIRILVGTDVISRGIDIKDINLVINYDVPKQAEDYVHRVGRTARASTTGVALTLVNENDMDTFHKIETLIEKEIPKINIPEEIGQSPTWQLHKRRPSKKRYSNKKNYKSNRSKNKRK